MAKISELLPEGGILPDAPAVKTKGDLTMADDIGLNYGNEQEVKTKWDSAKEALKVGSDLSDGHLLPLNISDTVHHGGGNVWGWSGNHIRKEIVGNTLSVAAGNTISNGIPVRPFFYYNSPELSRLDPGVEYEFDINVSIPNGVSLTLELGGLTNADSRSAEQSYVLTDGDNLIKLTSPQRLHALLFFNSASLGDAVVVNKFHVRKTAMDMDSIVEIDPETRTVRTAGDLVVDKLNGEPFSRLFAGKKREGVTITVNGDKDTYYPVLIRSELATYGFEQYSIGRGYGWHAPNEWNDSSTHRGALTFTFMATGDSFWGGGDRSMRVIEFHQNYSTMVAGLNLSVQGHVVWLRGGGAAYRITTPSGTDAMINIFDNDDGFLAANGTVYLPRTDTSYVEGEIYGRYPIRAQGNLGSLYEFNERVYSPHNRPTPNDIGTLSKTYNDNTAYDLGALKGTHGGYGDTTGSSTDWGANIWSMGPSYQGGIAGYQYVPNASHYGISWLRADNPNARAGVGEGMYIFEGGTLRGAIGRHGMYVSGDIYLPNSERLVLGNDADAEFWSDGNWSTFLDINGGGTFNIRDGDSSNATRFSFDVDSGYLTGTRWIGETHHRDGISSHWGTEQDVSQHYTTGTFYTDIGGTQEWQLRYRPASNAVKFTFNMAQGWLTGERWIGEVNTRDHVNIFFGTDFDVRQYYDGARLNTLFKKGDVWKLVNEDGGRSEKFVFDMETGVLHGTTWAGGIHLDDNVTASFGDGSEILQYARNGALHLDLKGTGVINFRDAASALSPTKIRFDVPNGSIAGDLWTGSVRIGSSQQMTMGDSEELTQYVENGSVNMLLKGNGLIRLRDGNSTQPVPPTPIRFDVRDGTVHAKKHVGNVSVLEGQLLAFGGSDNVASYYSNNNMYLDFDAGVDYILREKGDPDTTKFYFNMSNGYLSGTRWVGQTQYLNGVSAHWGTSTEVSQHFTSGNLYTDIDGDADWLIRDRNSGNVTRFLFDVSAGAFHANRFVGVATNSELLDNLDSTQFLRSDAPDVMLGTLEMRYGIHGGYADGNGTGANWGANIWSMGTSYDGSGFATTHTPASYGIAWMRDEHSKSHAAIGEGLYLFQNNILRGGMGTSGIYTAGNLTLNDNGQIRLGNGNDVIHHWNGSNYYTDIGGGGAWYIRDGNSSNAVRYTFDVDNGTIYATAFHGALVGTASNSELLDNLDSEQFIRADIAAVKRNRLAVEYGTHGGYGDTHGTGTGWGGSIWSMGPAHDGTVNGASYDTNANHWGLAWLRVDNPNAHASVGDGLYVYRSGILAGGLGHQGLYTTDANITGQASIGLMISDLNMYADKRILWSKDTDHAGIEFNADGDGGDNHLHFWTGDNNDEWFRWSSSSSAGINDLMSLKPSAGLWVKGNVSTDGKYYETGVALETKYLQRTGNTVKTMAGALRIEGGITNVSNINDGAFLDIDYRVDSGDTTGLRIKMDGEAGAGIGGDWLIDCWANVTAANTTINDRKFAVDGQGNLILNGTITWNGVKYVGFDDAAVDYATNAGKLDNLDSTQFLRSDADDETQNKIGIRQGIHGGYGGMSGGGNDWASTIWAIGSAHGGTGFGASWVHPSYGVAWQRPDSTGYLGVCGEGLYLYTGNAFKGAWGATGLYIDGQIYATNNITAYYSDSRLKVKLGDIDTEKAYEAVINSTKAIYRANDIAVANGYDADKIEIGMFADEFLEDFSALTPLAPFDTEDGVTSLSKENYRTFDYGRFTTLLAAAFEHMATENEAVVSELREENKALRSEMEELKSTMNEILAKLS